MNFYAIMRYDDEDTDILGITIDENKAEEMKQYAIDNYGYNCCIVDFTDDYYQLRPLWMVRYVRGVYKASKRTDWFMLSRNGPFLICHSSAYNNWSGCVYADTEEEAIEAFKDVLKSSLEPWQIEKGKIKFECK